MAKKKKDYRSGRPIISFVDSPFRPMLNILARLIFQLIPVACPDHFASGDVYALLTILKSAPVDADLILVNQDLAGFFTSIDQERFVGAWFMLLDFLRPHMDVSDNEAFSVYPGETNNPGDIIKGRTFRGLNLTRKIIIKDVPGLITSALDMQTFALGQKCIRQSRGSPMGSPLSPALCLMVVLVNKFGPSTSNRSSPTTTFSFATSGMWTTGWSLVTHVSQTWHHTKSSLTMASTANPPYRRLNRTKNFWALCWKPNRSNWSIKDTPTSRKFYLRSQPLLPKYSWVVSDPVVTLWSKGHSPISESDKVWTN